MLLAFVFALSFGLLILFIYMKYKHLYWKQHHVPYIKPTLVWGNLKDLMFMQVSFGELFKRLYEHETLRNASVGGIYLLHQPAVILRDPDIIKLVLIKHFDKFLNRYEAANYQYDKMGAMTLPLSKYPIWRGCRIKMSEVFTTGKIKYRMYPLMLQIAQQLETYMTKKIAKHRQSTSSTAIEDEGVVLEVKEMCSLFTTDLTSILHYGSDAEGLKQGYSCLRHQTLQLFDINIFRTLDFFIVFFLPHLTGWLRAKVFSRTYMKFMRKFTQNIYHKRNNHTSTQHQGDLMDILLQFQKENSTSSDHYSQHSDFIPSQVAIFLLAGFETSSSVLGFILYELAKQPELQQRLRGELKQAFGTETTLSYDKMQSLYLLHQVVCEGLRMYPAAAFINRECTAKRSDGDSGGFHLTSDVFIPNGMPVYVSILGLHRDPKHWPLPNNFIPERFNPTAIENMHPMTYIPFGAGPHNCIASRLGILQVKLGLAHLLKQHRVQMCSQTVKEIRFDTKSFMLQAKGGIYLKFIRNE